MKQTSLALSGNIETNETAPAAADAAALSAATPAPPIKNMIRLKFCLSDEGVAEIAWHTLRPLIEQQEEERAALAARWANAPIGEVMPDGSLYAGISPETGKKMYAMPLDAEVRLDFNAAAAYAKTLNAEKALGHDDWRVPGLNELDALFNNLSSVGRFFSSEKFLAGRYWSNKPGRDSNRGCSEDSRTGHQSNTTLRSVPLWVRCVR
ncbi:MAG: DUF1566 domain-containing protein [Alphaproteobacteria bacterium]